MNSRATRAVSAIGVLVCVLGCDRDNPAASAPGRAATGPAVVDDAAHDYAPSDVYTDLRGKVFALKPGSIAVPEGQPYAALMEFGAQKAAVTLAVVADGTTSLYFSNGGGVIGAGGHPPVREASQAFLADVAAAADQMQVITEPPFPTRAKVRFYLLTRDGIRTAEAPGRDLTDGKHPLSGLFRSGHAVVSAIRENSPEEK